MRFQMPAIQIFINTAALLSKELWCCPSKLSKPSCSVVDHVFFPQFQELEACICMAYWTSKGIHYPWPVLMLPRAFTAMWRSAIDEQLMEKNNYSLWGCHKTDATVTHSKRTFYPLRSDYLSVRFNYCALNSLNLLTKMSKLLTIHPQGR